MPLRRHLPYTCGKITLTLLWSFRAPLRAKTRHQTGEVHQVREPEECAASSHDHFKIRGDKVSPLRGNRANRSVVDAQQKPLAGPVIPFADAGKQTASEWVERMGYADKLHRSSGKVCIPS